MKPSSNVESDSSDIKVSVLCKDCEYREKDLDNTNRTYYWCRELGRFVMLDDYCSFGYRLEVE